MVDELRKNKPSSSLTALRMRLLCSRSTEATERAQSRMRRTQSVDAVCKSLQFFSNVAPSLRMVSSNSLTWAAEEESIDMMMRGVGSAS